MRNLENKLKYFVLTVTDQVKKLTRVPYLDRPQSQIFS